MNFPLVAFPQWVNEHSAYENFENKYFKRLELEERHYQLEKLNQQTSKVLLRKETLYTGESLYFDLLRQWLLDCDEHAQGWGCISNNTKPSFQPTRLLYIGGSDVSRLELRETKLISKTDTVKYVALSHRWASPTDAKKLAYCTTRDNYSDRLQGFAIDTLPKTFQDAIKVTQALGQKFLWIDALCIIQAVHEADNEDWKNEAGRMEETFSSAYCTIAADAASGWDQGFLPSAYALPITNLSQSPEPIYTCSTDYKFDFHKDVNKSELNKRAWVLQERVLSRRILHFTNIHTYFACGLGVRCGYIANQTINLGSSLRRDDFFILDPQFPYRLQTSGYNETIRFVQDLFTQYARGGLSKESDKEIAISGLLQRMDDAFRCEHKYGIFECFMSRLLLWRLPNDVAGRANTTPEDQRLPSWSWMAHNRIDFFPKEEKIKIRPSSIKFAFGSELRVPIRYLQDCKIKQRGSQHIIQDNNNHDMGELWFDRQPCTTAKDCVVVGIQRPDKCFILILLKKNDNYHQRIGAGEIKAHCLSNDYRKGMVI